MTLREASLRGTRRGLRFYAQGRHVEALQAFDGALALDDTICLTWIGKGRALLELQRFPEAQAAFEHALSLDPTNSDALQGKVHAHEASRREDTQQVAAEVVGNIPDPVQALGMAATLVYHGLRMIGALIYYGLRGLLHL
ncbi:MAG: tetratricopeptide repeat protein [Ktedonobacterales bacterium]